VTGLKESPVVFFEFLDFSIGGARDLCPVYPPPPYNAEDLHLAALCQRSFAGIAVHDGSSFKSKIDK